MSKNIIRHGFNRLTLALFTILLLAGGCANYDPADPRNLTTPEIVAILENAPVQQIATSHSQHISITLKNGTSYFGLYRPDEVPPAYKSHPEKFDILNLSEAIKAKRWKKWNTICE